MSAARFLLHLERTMGRVTTWGLAPLAMVIAMAGSAHARNPDGSLGLIRRPASTHPTLVLAGESLSIRADAPNNATGWQASLSIAGTEIAPVELDVFAAEYDWMNERWLLEAQVPIGAPADLYDLTLHYDGGPDDTNRIAVKVYREWPQSYTIAHYSDTQNLFAIPGVTPKMDGVVSDLNVLQPELALLTGDLITYGTASEYQGFITRLEQSRVPTFMVPGNHDVFWVPCFDRDKYQERYERYIGERDYAFDFGTHHFVGFELSGYKGLCPHADLSAEQIGWLESDLQASASAPLKLAFGHQLEHSADALEWLAETYGIDMYLYGHVHKDAVRLTESTIYAAVGWAGDGMYRLIHIANDEIESFTYMGDDIASIAGGDAVHYTIEHGEPGSMSAEVVFTSALGEAVPNVKMRVEMPGPVSAGYQAEGGEIWQQIETDDAVYVYIKGIVVAPDGDTTVRISSADGAPPAEPDPEPDDADPMPENGTGGCAATDSGGSPLAVGWMLLALLALRRDTRRLVWATGARIPADRRSRYGPSGPWEA